MWVSAGNLSPGIPCGTGLAGRSPSSSSRLQVGLKPLRCAPALWAALRAGLDPDPPAAFGLPGRLTEQPAAGQPP